MDKMEEVGVYIFRPVASLGSSMRSICATASTLSPRSIHLASAGGYDVKAPARWDVQGPANIEDPGHSSTLLRLKLRLRALILLDSTQTPLDVVPGGYQYSGLRG